MSHDFYQLVRAAENLATDSTLSEISTSLDNLPDYSADLEGIGNYLARIADSLETIAEHITTKDPQ